MKRLASSCICANGLCTTLPTIDNVSMKVKGLSCGWRSAVAKDWRRAGGGRERSFWAELIDIWALNLDPIFVSGEIDCVLFGDPP